MSSDAVDATPSLSVRSHGHRRGASEYIGGNGRLGGAPDLISSSPMRPLDDLPLPLPTDPAAAAAAGSPVRKRGHAHKRSTAMSSHDVSTILQPRDANIMSGQGADETSQAAPTTEAQTANVVPAPPPSFPIGRPRVGFSNNIEIIPRPLSTISSEAESITSGTGAGSPSPRHSGAFSPAVKRNPRSARSSLSEVEFATQYRTPIEQPEDHEGDVNGFIDDECEVPATDVDRGISSVNDQARKWLLKRPIVNLDRRSSEPSLVFGSLQKPRRSSVSLRDPITKSQSLSPAAPTVIKGVKRKSSASRVMAWANSMMHRKDKKSSKRPAKLHLDLQPDERLDAANPESPAPDDFTPMTEAELEELFSHDPFSQPDDGESGVVDFGSRMDMSSLRDFTPRYSREPGDSDPMIDLDAAMGPTQTPSRDGKTTAGRRQLHSSRGNREFINAANTFHRRAESAPTLTPFEHNSLSGSPMHSPMADVFEEEEEEDSNKTGPTLAMIGAPAFSFPQAPLDQDEAMNKESSGHQQLGSSIAPSTPTASSTIADTSITEDAVMHETESVEIVEAHEEPRASTLTKSSDSSETATLAADVPMSLAPQTSSISFTAPVTLGGSTDSPDMGRRQTSFDGPRLGTSASSAAECRTLSSFASERPETRPSVDDVPSLTSSRSTMISSTQAPRRDVLDRPGSTRSHQLSEEQQEQRRRKRNSIQSLAKLMSGPFGESRHKLSLEHSNASSPSLLSNKQSSRNKEKRLSKLMFWRVKQTRTDESER